METGTSQFLASIVAAITTVIVAILGGSFTVQAARIQASKNTGGETPHDELSKGKLFWWIILVGVLALPFSCILGLTFNSIGIWLSGDTLATEYPINVYLDSIDPTVVGAIVGSIGFILGVVMSRLGVLNKK